MKIRALSLFTVLLLFVCFLASCVQENNVDSSRNESSVEGISEENNESSLEESSKPIEFDTTNRNIEFKEIYFGRSFSFDYRDYMITYHKNELKPFVVDSKESAEALISMIEFDYDNSVSEYFENLPDDYFEEYILLANDFSNGSLGMRRDVERVFADENGVTVEYNHASPICAADASEPCTVLVELKREDVLGCQQFNAVSWEAAFSIGGSEWWFHDESFIGTLDLNYMSIVPDKPYTISVLSHFQLNKLAEGSSSDEFKQYAESKDDSFFEEKALIIVYVSASSAESTFEIDSIMNISEEQPYDENKTVVKVNQKRCNGDGVGHSHILVAEVYLYDIFPCFNIVAETVDEEK